MKNVKKINFFYAVFIIFLFVFGCENKKQQRSIKVVNDDTVRIVTTDLADTNVQDTTFIVPVETPDSSILKRVRAYEDSVLLAKIRADSLRVLFIQDSINFRRITLLINGGYNGWDDRYKRWLIAREAIMNLEEK